MAYLKSQCEKQKANPDYVKLMAALAAYLPARKASTADPATVLRQD